VDARMVEAVSPRTFSVGVAVRGRGGTGRLAAHGGGRLIIDPAQIVLAIGPVTRRLSGVDRIVHTARSVQMLTTRFLAPLVNTRFVITDGRVSATASVPMWMRDAVSEAMRAAGYEIEPRPHGTEN
jgi:hypothetical protein